MQRESDVPQRATAILHGHSLRGAASTKQTASVVELQARNRFFKSALTENDNSSRHRTPRSVRSGNLTPEAPSISPLSEPADTSEVMELDEPLSALPKARIRPPTSAPVDDAVDVGPSSPPQPHTLPWPTTSTSASHPMINDASMPPPEHPSAPTARLDSTTNTDISGKARPTPTTEPKQLSPEDTILLAAVARLRVTLWQNIQLSLWSRYQNFHASVPDCHTFYTEYLFTPQMSAWERDAFVPVNLVPEPGSYDAQRDDDRRYAASLSGKAGSLRALREMRRGEVLYASVPPLLKVYTDAVDICWEGVAKRVGWTGEVQALGDRWEELTKDQRESAEVAEEDATAGLLSPEERADVGVDGDAATGLVVGPDEDAAVHADPEAATDSYKGKGKQKMVS